MRIVINHLNKAFQDAMSDAEKQSINEHMTKFKGRMSCKQYMKNKSIKWGFKLWCQWCSKTGYLYKFNLYLDKKEKNRAWAFGIVVSDLSQKLWKYTLDALFWQLFLILQHCLKRFSIGEYTVLVQFEVTGKVWLLWKKIKMSKEVTSIFNMLLTWLQWNGLIIVESQWLVHFLRNVIKYQQLQVE